MNNANPESDSGTKLLLKLALHEEEGLAGRANWLDTKTGAVLGFVIVSIAELLGFLFLASTEKAKPIPYPCLLTVLFFVGLGALLIGMYYGLLELFPMGFEYGAGSDKLAGLAGKKASEIENECLGLLQQASVKNRAIVDKKKTFLKRTVFFVGMALGCYSVAVALLFLSLRAV